MRRLPAIIFATLSVVFTALSARADVIPDVPKGWRELERSYVVDTSALGVRRHVN